MKKIISSILIMCLIGIILPVMAEQDLKLSPFKHNQRDLEEYRLSKSDVISIIIIGLPNTNGFSDIMVGIDGYVNIPYAGTLKLAGLTINEAHALLNEKLGEYLKIPNMSIMVKSYGPRKVYMLGEVNSPGIYNLNIDNMNIFAALSSAGGITRRGRPKHVAVVREIDGELYMQEINFDDFVKNQDTSQNVRLQDGDMIYVPRSNKIIFNEDILPLASMYGLYRSIIR